MAEHIFLRQLTVETLQQRQAKYLKINKSGRICKFKVGLSCRNQPTLRRSTTFHAANSRSPPTTYLKYFTSSRNKHRSEAADREKRNTGTHSPRHKYDESSH